MHLPWSAPHKHHGLVCRAQREGEDGLRMCRLVGVRRQEIVETDVPNGVQKVLDVRPCRCGHGGVLWAHCGPGMPLRAVKHRLVSSTTAGPPT